MVSKGCPTITDAVPANPPAIKSCRADVASYSGQSGVRMSR